MPQHSIRGVELGMSRPAVVRRLGRPSHVVHTAGDLGPSTTLEYKGLRVTFAFDRGVSQVESLSPADRTATGVGVGSSLAEIKAGVAGVRCEPGHCHLGVYVAGHVITDFFVRRGRVWRVVVGRVLD